MHMHLGEIHAVFSFPSIAIFIYKEYCCTYGLPHLLLHVYSLPEPSGPTF